MAQYEATQGQRHLVFWRDKLDDPSFIYVIQPVGDSAVKVGFTTDLMKRLAQIQTSHPRHVRIMHCVPGDRQLEAAFHKRLESSRTDGGREWFDGPDVPEFLEHVESLADRMVAHYEGHGIAPGITEQTPTVESDDDRSMREMRWARIGRLWLEGWSKERIRIDVKRMPEEFETDVLRMRAEGNYELDEALVGRRRGWPAWGEIRGIGAFRVLEQPVRKPASAPVTVRFVKPDPKPVALTPAQAHHAAILGVSHDEWRRRGLGRDSEAA